MKKTCISCKTEFKVSPSRSNRKYCSHPCYTSDQKERLVEHCRQNMGTTVESRSSAAKLRCSDKTKHSMYGRKHTDEARLKQSKAKKGVLVGARNGMFGKTHGASAREKISESISRRIMTGKTGWKTGHFKSRKMGVSMHFRSSWEEKFMGYLDRRDDVMTFMNETVRIRYLDSVGRRRWYIPDFLIEYADGRKEIVELKPECFIDYDINKRKAAAGREYCKSRGLKYRILTQKYLKRIGVL